MPYRSHRAGVGTVPWLTIETTVSADGRLTTVRVDGELDRDSAAELIRSFRAVLTDAVPQAIEVVLSAVTFVDAAGVRSLVTCRQLAIEAGACLRLADPAPQVGIVLDIAGLSEVFGLPGGPAVQGGDLRCTWR